MILSWQRFDLGLRLALCGAPLLVCVFSLAEFPEPSGWILLGAGLLGGVLSIIAPAVAIIASKRALWIVGVPFWAVRLPWGRVAAVDSAEVHPVEDFGGWGVKGSSRRKGLLFAARGEAAVRVRRDDGRLFLGTADSPKWVVAECERRIETLTVERPGRC